MKFYIIVFEDQRLSAGTRPAHLHWSYRRLLRQPRSGQAGVQVRPHTSPEDHCSSKCLTRSIYWEKEYLEPTAKFFQPAWVVNYPEADVDWTRISEYKHSPNQPAGVKDHPGTVVYREYSTDIGDPYYPVPNKRNRDLYSKYQVRFMKCCIYG